MEKISELRRVEFNSDNIDNCFCVDDVNRPTHVVKMSDVFNWIKEKAKAEGLTVVNKGEQIIFIKGEQ